MQHYAYSAFGKILKISDGSGNDISANPMIEPYFTFIGREWDAESQLYYYRARAYDPSIGRFLQTDPHPGDINNPITAINKYVYAGNNPYLLAWPAAVVPFTGEFKESCGEPGIGLLFGSKGCN